MKAKYCKYESEGKVHAEQHWIFCPGCKCIHAMGKNIHTFNGDFEKPTFTPSLLWQATKELTDEEAERVMRGEKITLVEIRCHSFVTAGRIQFLNDCTHALANQTVDLPDVPEDAR